MWQCDADGAAVAMLHIGTGVTTGQVGVTATIRADVGLEVRTEVGAEVGLDVGAEVSLYVGAEVG